MRVPANSTRLLCLLLAFLSAFAFTVRGYHDEREALHFRDFKQPYSSARCLLKHCDSYIEVDTRAAYLAAGGIDNDKVVFDPYSALYPPFSLAVLAPLAALPYPVAHALWEGLLAASFSLALVLTADLCLTAGLWLPPVLLLMLFAVTSTILLMLGQISGLVISLLVIAFACLLRGRLSWLAGACLLVAVLLKPHDAAIPILYLCFAGPAWRRVFVVVLVLAVVATGASLAWFSSIPADAHWLAELEANLHGNAQAGSVNDPGLGHLQALNLVNLQAIFAVLTGKASSYNFAALATFTVLLAGWLVPVVRLRNTLPKHLLALAAIGCLALLPIYHRQYDTRLLILAFPAVAYLLSRTGHRLWGLLGFGLLTLATVLSSHQAVNFLTHHASARIEQAGAGQTLLFFRPLPEITLVLFLYFLGSLLQAMRTQDIEAGQADAGQP